MGFFSDLGKKTSETAGKISKEAKLKLKMNDNKNKIKSLYEEIGKKIYEKHVAGSDIDETSNECAQIDTLSKEMEEARIEILHLNNKRICSKCSAEIEKNAQFCPKCGEKLEPVETPAAPAEATEAKAEETPAESAPEAESTNNEEQKSE